jgi:hypothetical protein
MGAPWLRTPHPPCPVLVFLPSVDVTAKRNSSKRGLPRLWDQRRPSRAGSTAANIRSLAPRRTPVKWNRSVCNSGWIASILCSTMSLRAFSIEPRESFTVGDREGPVSHWLHASRKAGLSTCGASPGRESEYMRAGLRRCHSRVRTCRKLSQRDRLQASSASEAGPLPPAGVGGADAPSSVNEPVAGVVNGEKWRLVVSLQRFRFTRLTPSLPEP